jgi:hypothetical protein
MLLNIMPALLPTVDQQRRVFLLADQQNPLPSSLPQTPSENVLQYLFPEYIPWLVGRQ